MAKDEKVRGNNNNIETSPSRIQINTSQAERSDSPTLPDTYPFDADGALCREFLLERGYCCGNGCRNCPYDDE